MSRGTLILQRCRTHGARDRDLPSASDWGKIRLMKDCIIIDPAICNGRPVVKGTRITVQTVMEFLAAGDSVDDVLEAYPSLTREHVLACMEWASRLMANHFQITALT